MIRHVTSSHLYKSVIFFFFFYFHIYNCETPINAYYCNNKKKIEIKMFYISGALNCFNVLFEITKVLNRTLVTIYFYLNVWQSHDIFEVKRTSRSTRVKMRIIDGIKP